MKIGFDLDGVICASDSAMLGLLHDFERKGSLIGGELMLRHYYLSRPVLHDPREFCADIDQIYVVTCRSVQTMPWTQAWVNQWVPGAMILWARTPAMEALYAKGRYEEASVSSAESKAQLILRAGIEVHFDNNPFIVRRLRELGIKAILVGGALG
jgi:hypothetical protein